MLGSGFVKNEKLVNGNVQHSRNVEKGIKRNRLIDVGSLHVANKCRASINQLGELLLRVSAQFSVVGDLEPELHILGLEFHFHNCYLALFSTPLYQKWYHIKMFQKN